jgi:integrase
VLDWATTLGYREGLNPARWKGHLDKVLPPAEKVKKTKHHPALPFKDMGPFMKRLRELQGTGARALEFGILTAARSGEVRGATWDEFDFDEGVWTVPAERMKGKKEHRVPLSPAALALAKSMPKMAKSNYVFAAPRGGVLSDMTLTAVVRRLEAPAVPHGFRSTFRDWASETTNYPNHVAEMALAHFIGDKVEAAYRRGDLFKKRTRMMNDWATFCARVEAKGLIRTTTWTTKTPTSFPLVCSPATRPCGSIPKSRGKTTSARTFERLCARRQRRTFCCDLTPT